MASGPTVRHESALSKAGPRHASVPPPGTKVRYFGDYELLEEIAHGGMGVSIGAAGEPQPHRRR